MIEWLEYRYSGGAANADPALSIGGRMSSVRIPMQAVDALVNVVGVTVLWLAKNTAGGGIGQLIFVVADHTLEWREPADVFNPPGTPVDVSVDGRYLLRSTSGAYMVVEVDASALPVADATDNLTVTNPTGTVFGDISGVERLVLTPKYRCIYLTNTHPSTTITALIPSVITEPSANVLEFSKDQNSPWDPVADPPPINEVMLTDEDTDPVGMTFANGWNVDIDYSIGLPPLPPGHVMMLWLKRTYVDAGGLPIVGMPFSLGMTITW